MRKAGLLLAGSVLAALLVGCGGSSGTSTSRPPITTSLTRVVAGYVYVTGNSGNPTGPAVIIAPTSNPPSGYFKPTAGIVTLSVTNGSIIQAPATLNTDMAVSNEILATITSLETTPSYTISGTGLEYNGIAKGNVASATVSLGASTDNGKILGISVGTSTVYAPGAVASLRVVCKDNGINTNLFKAPADSLLDGLVAGNNYSIAVAAFDANGIVVSGASPVVTTDQPTKIAVNSSSSLLTPDVTGALVAGPVMVTATVGGILTSFSTTYSFGMVSSVALAPAGPTSVVWAVSGAPATVALTATVKNQFNSPMPGQTMTLTTANAPSNTWIAGGSAFSVASGSSTAAGTLAVVFTAPTSAAGPLSAGNKAIKGDNTLTATVGSITGIAVVHLTRPLASLVVAGATRLDVGQTTQSGSDQFSVTGGLDVDNDPIASPSGVVAWTLTPVAGAGNVGDLDDASLKSTTDATINGASGVMTGGTKPGQVTVKAAIGGVNSNNLTVDIYGAPAKIKYTPATTVSGYSGAQNVTFNMLDNWGHIVPTSEYTFTKTVTADSLSGAIASNGAGNAFALTPGISSGTFTLTVNGSWTGAKSGSSVIAKTRTSTIAP